MKCQYLFHQHIDGVKKHQRTNHHVHQFHHLEWLLDGEGEIIIENKTWKPFAKGFLVYVPAGVKHGFHYKTTNCNWISIKFDMTQAHMSIPPLSFPADSAERYMIKSIEKLLIDNLYPQKQIVIVEHLLTALLQYIEAKETIESKPVYKLSDKICSFVGSSEPEAANITALANHFNYSPNYLSSKFKKETGQCLKSYLDNHRCQEAKKLLEYSDMSIKEISEELKFANVYTFSRFFKRLENYSPGKFRKIKNAE